MSYVKVHYRRIWLFGFIPIPVRHTFLEIDYNGKVVRKGFYNKEGKDSTLKFIGSLFDFVDGKVEDEKTAKGGEILTEDDVKVRKVLKAMNELKWEKFHALKRNCFHWRNAVLEKSKVEVPRDSWLG